MPFVRVRGQLKLFAASSRALSALSIVFEVVQFPIEFFSFFADVVSNGDKCVADDWCRAKGSPRHRTSFARIKPGRVVHLATAQPMFKFCVE